MTEHVLIKDPDADLDFWVDWRPWLDETSSSVDTLTWTVDPGLTSHDPDNTFGFHIVWLSGGEAGESYDVTSRIVTDDPIPRTDERTLTIVVVNR